MPVTQPCVLVDATAVPADRGGVGRYVDSLVAALDSDGARLAVVCQPRDAALYGSLAVMAPSGWASIGPKPTTKAVKVTVSMPPVNR